MLEASVPWSAESVEGKRLEFCRLADSGVVSFVELCRRFGIAPKTGYKWLARFRVEGAAGLVDRSRRPLRSPARTLDEVEALVCALRESHPAWGGRKIARRLKDVGHTEVPAPSTVTDILRRNGLLGSVEPHRGGYGSFEAQAPNDLWQMDFKGWFETVSTGQCHPFDVLDDHSRFSLCLYAGYDESRHSVKAQLTGVFNRYGLPKRILCDNGPPWGSSNRTVRDTRLTVWLVDLGIDTIHSRPRHPQTLGKDERFHRTLDLEVISTRTWDNHHQVQTAFDLWRPVYNYQRPHQGIDLATPADRYRPSPRPMPKRIEPVDYPDGYQVRKVETSARITYQGNRYRVGRPYAGRLVGIVPTTTDGVVDVYYRHHHIRTIHLQT